MPKPQRLQRSPLILWGEGQTEQLFLDLFKQLYSKRLTDKAILFGNGGGGSPGSILLELKRKHLQIGNSDTPALVLIDEDKGLDRQAEKILRDYPNITVLFSVPQCLEGLLLDLLGDLPSQGQWNSDRLKDLFQDSHLGEREHVQRNFKKHRGTLFPMELLESKRSSHPVLKEIYRFLEL